MTYFCEECEEPAQQLLKEVIAGRRVQVFNAGGDWVDAVLVPGPVDGASAWIISPDHPGGCPWSLEHIREIEEGA
jgi:hypothetical protein